MRHATPKRKIAGDIIKDIQILALMEAWAPAAVHRLLSDEPKYKGRVPSLRSVQRIFRDALPKSGPEPWRLQDSEGQEAALILPVIGALMASTKGRFLYITQDLAKWIVRVRQVAADLHPLNSAYVAVEYLRLAEEEEESTRRGRTGAAAYARRITTLLDVWLGYAPWRSKARAASYQKILDAEERADRPSPGFEDIEKLELVRRGLMDKSQLTPTRVNKEWYPIVLRDEVQDG